MYFNNLVAGGAGGLLAQHSCATSRDHNTEQECYVFSTYNLVTTFSSEQSSLKCCILRANKEER